MDYDKLITPIIGICNTMILVIIMITLFKVEHMIEDHITTVQETTRHEPTSNLSLRRPYSLRAQGTAAES